MQVPTFQRDTPQPLLTCSPPPSSQGPSAVISLGPPLHHSKEWHVSTDKQAQGFPPPPSPGDSQLALILVCKEAASGDLTLSVSGRSWERTMPTESSLSRTTFVEPTTSSRLLAQLDSQDTGYLNLQCYS